MPVVTGRGDVAPGRGDPGTPDQANHDASEGGDSDVRLKPEDMGQCPPSEPSVHGPSRSAGSAPRTTDGTAEPRDTLEVDGSARWNGWRGPDDRMGDEQPELQLPGTISNLDAAERRHIQELDATSQGRLGTNPHDRLALIAFKTLVIFLLVGIVALTLVTVLGKPSETLLDFLKFTNVSLFGLTTFIAGYYFGKRSNNE